jgi:predicted DNA-binding transcriptional regulator AlpA
MERCLTQREASYVLRCSERTLERLRLSGLGPRYVKTIRRVLYRESDLDAWLTARLVRSTSEQAGERRAVR